MIRRITVVLLVATLCFAMSGCKGKSSAGSMMALAGPLMGLLSSRPELSQFSSLLNASSLGSMLGGDNPLTLLAPSNDALGALGESAIGELMNPSNQGQLDDLLKNHIVAGSVPSSDLTAGSSLTSLFGNELPVAQGADGGLSVGGATIEGADLESSGSIVHVIDKVLMPGS